MQIFGCLFLWCYRTSWRIRSKCFSKLAASAFASFGKKTTLTLPIQISGEERIGIGERVYVGANSWLQTLSDGENTTTALYIGDGTSIAGACVISAVRNVKLEEDVLLARNVYISDHIHRYDQINEPVLRQGIDNIAPVLIGRGAWLGQNVVVCPGVTIGRGSVIGANSIVKQDVPEFSVAVGAPARVVKTIRANGVQG